MSIIKVKIDATIVASQISAIMNELIATRTLSDAKRVEKIEIVIEKLLTLKNRL